MQSLQEAQQTWLMPEKRAFSAENRTSGTPWQGRAGQDTPCPPASVSPLDQWREYMLSMPLKDRTRSFIDLFSQIRTVEEATHCRDKIILVCFSLFCNKVSLQFQEIQYPIYIELAKQIF